MRRLSLLVLFVLLLALTSGFVWHTKSTQQMIIRVSAKDLSDEGISIITPSDESFESALAEFGEIPPEIASLKPYSVIVRNTSTRPVVSLMLMWELVNSQGDVSTQHYEYVAASALQGKEAVGRYVIRPGAQWFFMPGFDAEIKHQGLRDLPARGLNRIAQEVSQLVSVTVSLDGAFFDDGVFVGPNNTEFFEKVKAFQKTRRDVLNELSMKRKTSPDGENVLGEVESLAEQPRKRIGKKSTTADYYDTFKSDFAKEVMSMKRVSGTEKTLDYHLGSLKKRWPILRKKSLK